MIGTGALAVLIFLNIKRVPGNVLQKVKRYDWIGSFLLVASLVAILVPLSWGMCDVPLTPHLSGPKTNRDNYDFRWHHVSVDLLAYSRTDSARYCWAYRH